MSYSLDPISDDCYPGTTILRNKHNIRDEKLFNDVEATVVSAKTVLWEQHPLLNTFDFIHYRAIHRFLFEDLYDWAGHIRTVNISKKGTRFCPVESIEIQANSIFNRLHNQNFFLYSELSDFTTEVVDFYCATNDLHPFREGNGRTQRIFITQLIRNADYEFDFAKVDNDLLMIATIQSANGVTDLLTELFGEMLSLKN
jgi:cell filamentation protein